MSRTLGKFILVFCLVGALAGSGLHLFLRHYVSTPSFRTLIRTELEKVLKTEIRIKEIRAGFPNQVVLSGIEVLSPDDHSAWMEIHEIAFRYRLVQLVTRKLDIPAVISLDGASLFFEGEGWVEELRKAAHGASPSALFSRIQLKGGRIYYRVPRMDAPVLLEEVEGGFSPGAGGRLKLHLRAQASGLIEGPVELKGHVHPFSGQYDFTLNLDSVAMGHEWPFEAEDLAGSIRFTEREIRLDGVRLKSRGWQTVLNGVLRNWSAKPLVEMTLETSKAEDLLRLECRADLGRETLEGRAAVSHFPESGFKGRIRYDDYRVMLKDLHFDNGYTGLGSLDFRTGDYALKFEREMQRITVSSNLRGREVKIGLDFDHLKLLGRDLVTAAEIRLVPVASLEGDPWRMQGLFSTDYFILDENVFSDLQGSFMVDPEGIRDFLGSWGYSFELTGDMDLRKNNAFLKLVLRVQDFDLARAREMATRPMPRDLQGRLEGKLRIEGWFRKPEVEGLFSIKDGMLGKLDFDRGLIKFRGFVPYLSLYDSRLLRGRTSLYLTGAFDLSMKNMFAGVKLETSEKIILWKGLSMATSGEAGAVDIEMPVPSLSSVGIALGSDDRDSPLGQQDALQDESYVAMGPRVRF